MRKPRPTYQQLAERLASAEPVIEALKRHEVDAVVGEEKIAFLLLRKVEEAWLESNGEFASIFGLNGIGMFQADTPAMRFSRVNTKFAEMVGYPADELLTKGYTDLTHPEDRHRELKGLSRLILGKTDSWSIEKRCIRKDGREIWVAVHGTTLRDHAGRAAKVMAMIEDITARKHAEHEQRDVQIQFKKVIKEWTAGMLRIRRSLHSQEAKRKLIDQLLKSMLEFGQRFGGSTKRTASSNAGKPVRQRKAAHVAPRNTTRRKLSNKRPPKTR